MKKGICLSAIFPNTIYQKELLLQKIAKVKKETEFNCIEFYFEGNENDYMEIGNFLKKLKLSSVFLAGYPLKEKKYDLSSENNELRKQAVDFCGNLYECAKLLQAEKFLILSGPRWKVEKEEELVKQMTKSMTELHGLWKVGSPEITLEFFNDLGEPFLAVGTLKVTKMIFENLDRAGLGITFDTSHTSQLNEDIWNAYLFLEKWIHHLHLANSVSKFPHHLLYGDKHPLFGVENSDFSIFDMTNFMQRIKNRNRFEKLDICSIEVISRGESEEEWYFRQTIDQAEQIWTDKRRKSI